MTTLAVHRTHLPFWPTVGLAIVAWLIAWFIRGRAVASPSFVIAKVRPLSPSSSLPKEIWWFQPRPVDSL